jgi:hypothetical protein
MDTSLIINAQSYGLEPSKAQQIESIFVPMVAALKNMESSYNEIVSCNEIDLALTQRAKRLRLDISKIRINADKAHKEAKEESLRVGKAIDGIRNIIKYAVIDKEEGLKNIENYYENIERERIAALQAERENILSNYDIDGSNEKLGEMADDVWYNYEIGIRTQFGMKKAAERKAAVEREERERAERERQEQIRIENEKLKIELEQQRREKEAAEREHQAALEQQRREKEAAENEKQAILRAQYEEQRERQRKIEIEQEEEKERQHRLRTAPDIEKIKALLNDITSISIPVLADNKLSGIIGRVTAKLDDIIKILASEIKK